MDKLVEKENDLETKIQLLNEALKVAKSKHAKDEESKFYKQIKVLENKIIRDMGLRIKQLNKLFNNKNYEEAKKEARKILNWIHEDEENRDYAVIALRVLLQILSSERDYDRVIVTFEDYKNIGYVDKNCTDIFEKAKKEKKERGKPKINKGNHG